MLSKEELEKLSDQELEKLYQDKKAEFDKKLSKNRRIRAMLSRNVDKKQKIVNNLKKEINDLLVSHPELSVAKQEFDDTDQDPAELKSLIQERQKTLSQLQSKKLYIERAIAETSNHIEQQKALETQFQTEITSLISQSESYSNDDEENEVLELNRLSQEIKSAQDDLEVLLQEIEDIHGKIHQQG